MLPALYTIATEYQSLAALDIENMDEESFRAALNALHGDLTTKATNVIAYQKNVQAFADAITAAADKLKERAKVVQNKADSLHDYIKLSMEAAQITKLEGVEFVARIQNNPPAVVIDAGATVPAEFMVTPPAPEPYPNKTALKDALKNGQVIEGVRLEQKTRLVIK